MDSSQLFSLIQHSFFQQLPSISSYIDESDPFWDKVFQRNQEKHSYLEKLWGNNSKAVTKPNLIDHVIRHLRGERSATAFLNYVNKIIIDIGNKTPANQIDKYTIVLKELIQNFDNFDTRYLNHFGELCFLNFILVENNYQLREFEYPLINGKHIDYLLNSPKGNDVLVELLNIHIFEEKIKTEQALISLINRKIQNKISTKLVNIRDGEIDIIPNFVFILWVNESFIRQYQNTLKQYRGNSVLMEPFCLLFLLDTTGNDFEFHFGPISKIRFPDPQERE